MALNSISLLEMFKLKWIAVLQRKRSGLGPSAVAEGNARAHIRQLLDRNPSDSDIIGFQKDFSTTEQRQFSIVISIWSNSGNLRECLRKVNLE